MLSVQTVVDIFQLPHTVSSDTVACLAQPGICGAHAFMFRKILSCEDTHKPTLPCLKQKKK